MQPLYFLNANGMKSLMLQQVALQQQLIELQQQLIETQQQLIDTQRKLDKKTPKEPKDKDVFWHMNPEGLSSVEVANSKDPAVLRRFRDWNVEFAQKFIKPYVNAKVYGECLNQMTRGLSERIAKQDTLKELSLLDAGPTALPRSDEPKHLIRVR